MRLDPIKSAAVRVLVRELGWWRGLLTGLRIEWRVARGQPFAKLPPPADEKARLSREQIGPALVLFSILRGRLDQARAIEVTSAVVEAGAIAFLSDSIGPLDRATLDGMSQRERDHFVRDRMDRFPNATVRFDHIGTDEVRFTVTSCRFVELCRAVGLAELAPLFCAGDATFFGQVEPDVVLIRPSTLATGGASCPFTLRYAPRDEAPAATAD